MARSNDYAGRRKNEYTDPRRRQDPGAAMTVAGLLGLGMVSALFGLLVVGPALGKRATPPQEPEPAAAVAPLPESTDAESAPSTLEKPEAADRDGSVVPEEGEETASVPPGGASDAAPGAGGSTEPGEEESASRSEPDGNSPAAERTPAGTQAARDETPRPGSEPPAPSREEDTGRETRRRPAEEKSAAAGAEGLKTRASREVEDAEETPALRRRERDTARRGATAPAGNYVYRVRVGRFDSREEAEKFRAEFFKATGQGAEVVPVGRRFRLQVGAYRTRETADRVAEQIREADFRADVTQAETPRRTEERAERTEESGTE